MRLYLFGYPRLEKKGALIHLGRRKSLALLTYLAVSAQPHGRAELTTMFWPETSRRVGRAALRQCLAEIKSRLGSAVLHLDRQMVGLAADAPLWVDVAAFLHYLATAQKSADLEPLMLAADLYQADFMANFVLPHSPEFDQWVLLQATLFKQQGLQALAEVTQHLFAQGQVDKATAYASRRARLDVLNEAAQADLLRLYLYDGRFAAALQHYEWFVAQMVAELGRHPSLNLAQLLQEVRHAAGKTGELLTMPSSAGKRPSLRTSLPRALTPFSGRERELAEVVSRLRQPDCALLTLLGPGGIGKTTLALAVARHFEVESDYPVYFVPLEKVYGRFDLLTAIAKALAIPQEAQPELETAVIAELQGQNSLLVLDHFEQLVNQAEVLVKLLLAAPGLKLLVTSRVRLKLREEWPYPLGGLAYPETADDPEAARYEAVAFLAQAIRRHAPQRLLTDADWPHLVEICRAVEGLPLGLELAAGWVSRLSLPQIVEVITQQPTKLTAVWKNVPESHHSLNIICAQSWQLLEPVEQLAAQWLTLFSDGFTAEGAAALGVSEPVLQALVDKSFVQLYGTDTYNGRFYMYEVMRRFVQAQIDPAETAVAPARRRFIFYYATLLQRCDIWLQDDRQQQALAELTTELDNVRTAWQQTLTLGTLTEAEIMLNPLYRFYRLKGLFYYGVDDLTLALTHWQNACPEESRNPKTAVGQHVTRLLIRLGLCQSYVDQLDQAESHLLAALTRLPEGERAGWQERGIALSGLARLAVQRKQWLQAKQLYEEGLALLRAIDAPLEMAQALSGLGHVACGMGAYDEARRLDEESLAIYQQLHNPLGIAVAYNNLSHAAEMAGDYAQAANWLEQSLKIAAKNSAYWLTAVALSNLAHIARLRGEPYKAIRYLQESLKMRELYRLPGSGEVRKSIEVLKQQTEKPRARARSKHA